MEIAPRLCYIGLTSGGEIGARPEAATRRAAAVGVRPLGHGRISIGQGIVDTVSSKAPSKSKSSTKEQSPAKTRKGTSASPSTAARSTASARTRAAAAKATGTTGSARRGSSRRASKQPEPQEGDTVKPQAAAKRAKDAKAAKSAKTVKAGGGAKTKRATNTSAAGKPGTASAEARRKKRAPTEINGFTVGDHVVYPAHGVGRITGIDERTVGDQILQMFVVAFEKDKMTLLVPTDKVDSAGMRRLSSRETMDAAITTLRGRARTRRVMWSRRAQEYEAKLNSGDPVSIAEVVRDLHRNVGQPDQSYSERQMYEAALDRLAREFAAVDNTDTEQAATKLEDVLRAA